MCFLSYVTRFLLILFGILMPARQTQKALNDDNLVLWGKYWIVFACFFTIEMVSDKLLAWLPLYVESKLLIVLWLVVSAPQASVWIFDVILTPLLARHKWRIDYLIHHGKRHMLSDGIAYISGLWLRLLDFLKPLLAQLWHKKQVVPEQDYEEICEDDDVVQEAEEEPCQPSFDQDTSPNAFPKSNVMYANSIEQKFYEVTMPSTRTQSQSQITYSYRTSSASKQSLPELARKALDSGVDGGSSRLARSKRKQFVYDPQLETYTHKSDQMMNMDMNLLSGHHNGVELPHYSFPSRPEQRHNQ